MSTLSAYIPADLKEKRISSRQSAKQIIEALQICEKQAEKYWPILSEKFNTGDDYENCRRIWQFMKNNITYYKEPASKQCAKTVGRILHDRYGDCKAFATFAVAACRSIGVPVVFRLASYDHYDKIPTHVYAVANINGRKVVIDGVLNRFDNEAPFRYAYDVKPLN